MMGRETRIFAVARRNMCYDEPQVIVFGDVLPGSYLDSYFRK